ncbi:Hsp70 family chaperone [Cordyceps militaris CM01]|uniref:Hsp70 family chaperone n=1 Tax=Cordyceps militaris (strain CM01) TaxID=983644 RepID=G3JLB6_CORMM|nr:Hsp70 family chaperone [Cordyceps militaris CM01]EGX90490.1 Hsp70 family chaperone [Cordyceps militaris CM01]
MSSQPDIIVSVDFGTTFTGIFLVCPSLRCPRLTPIQGVGWRSPRTPVQVINDWPGSADRGERKVPTKLMYNPDGTLSSWGYLCADDEDLEYQTDGDHQQAAVATKTRREFFKMFVDSENLVTAQEQGVAQAPKTTEEAQQYAADFLGEVYRHVKRSVEMQVGLGRVAGGWAGSAVDFLFSVPTTWTRMETINAFKGVIRRAGFGVEGPRHSAQIDLTEAEAAAVATLKTSALRFRPGSLFLTVDAGGGTTDLSLMRVTSVDADCPQMAQLAAVKGVGIGSALIDRAFVRLVEHRLITWPDVRDRLPASLGLRMAQGHYFRTVKHKFGEKVYMQPRFKIQMEGVSHDFNHAGLGIENGRMVFSIWTGSKRMDPLTKWHVAPTLPPHPPSALTLVFQEFVILSGGLGSSAYVRQRLQQQLTSFPHPNATNAVVIPCQDPQLVVVRGLLLDHQQRTDMGNLSVLATRVARASYGVIVKEVYSPAKHFDQDVVQDPFDASKRWAVDQVQWMIRKGDTVNPNDPLIRKFEFHLAERDTTRSWNADIVISHNEPSFLPSSLKQAGVTRLCRVKSNLQGVQQHQLVLKQKRGTCFTRGHKFYICEFEIRVIVAPADLRFELWFGGQRFSGNHEPIDVKWDDTGARVKSG